MHWIGDRKQLLNASESIDRLSTSSARFSPFLFILDRKDGLRFFIISRMSASLLNLFWKVFGNSTSSVSGFLSDAMGIEATSEMRTARRQNRAERLQSGDI